MLKQIADKAGKELKARNQHGDDAFFKLLNTAYLGIRKLHTDSQGVATIDSGIEAGDLLFLETGLSFTVSVVTVDFYKSSPIRLALDLVENNNTVTVTRPVPVLSAQGGITGKVLTPVWTEVPVKIGTVLQIRDLKNDTTDSQFGMLLSSKFPVLQGDMLTFSRHYAPAKVEGVKFNYEGIYEVTFDKEPRWNSQ